MDNLVDNLSSTKTRLEQLNEANQKLDKARKKKAKVESDPHATDEEKKAANKAYNESWDEKIAAEGGLSLKRNLQKRGVDALKESSLVAKEKADCGRKLMAESIKQQEIAKKSQRKLEKRLAELKQDPDSKEIQERIQTHRNKRDMYNRKAKTSAHNGLKQATVNRTKEKAYQEAAYQFDHIGSTMKTGGALNLTDAAFDYCQGKCDFSTAVTNTVTNTACGTLQQVVGSVTYEGVMGGLSECCPRLAAKVPGLDKVTTLFGCAKTVWQSNTLIEGVQNVGKMAINMGGEHCSGLLATGALTAMGVSSGVLPAAIGGRVIWRGIQWGLGM